MTPIFMRIWASSLWMGAEGRFAWGGFFLPLAGCSPALQNERHKKAGVWGDAGLAGAGKRGERKGLVLRHPAYTYDHSNFLLL